MKNNLYSIKKFIFIITNHYGYNFKNLSKFFFSINNCCKINKVFIARLNKILAICTAYCSHRLKFISYHNDILQ